MAQLQLDLQQQQDHEQQQVTSASKEAEAIKVVEEQLQKANNELTVSATNAADLQEKFTAQEDKLKEAQAKVESLQQEVHEGKAIVAEVSRVGSLSPHISKHCLTSVVCMLLCWVTDVNFIEE